MKKIRRHTKKKQGNRRPENIVGKVFFRNQKGKFDIG